MALFLHDLSNNDPERSANLVDISHMSASALGTMMAPNCLTPLQQSGDITALVMDAKTSAVVRRCLFTFIHSCRFSFFVFVFSFLSIVESLSEYTPKHRSSMRLLLTRPHSSCAATPSGWNV
jgi:hypothetical protein